MIHLNPTISIIILKVNGLLSKDGSARSSSQLILLCWYHTDRSDQDINITKKEHYTPISFMNIDEKILKKKYQQTASRNTYTKRIIHHDQLLQHMKIINVICHSNRIKERKHMLIFTDI